MCEKYINIQTNKKLEISSLETLKDNTMLKTKTKLWVKFNIRNTWSSTLRM